MKKTHENPFLTRIIYEPQLIETDSFGIVADIEPIVPEHYLFYSKAWVPSIADCNEKLVSEFLEKRFSELIGEPYTYFERGRASFCTSMNGVQHGHGHLVPLFRKELKNLFPYGTVEVYSSMREAYAACSAKGQYLLWGNLGEEFFLIRDVEQMPKRIIRNTIKCFQN